MDAKPNPIDLILYAKPNLKMAIMDNFMEANEGRPLKEFRESMKENSVLFLKAFFDSMPVKMEINEKRLEDFQRQYYGEDQ